MRQKPTYVLSRVKTAYKKLSERIDTATGRRYTRGNIAAALCRQFGFHRATAYRHIKVIEQELQAEAGQPAPTAD